MIEYKLEYCDTTNDEDIISDVKIKEFDNGIIVVNFQTKDKYLEDISEMSYHYPDESGIGFNLYGKESAVNLLLPNIEECISCISALKHEYTITLVPYKYSLSVFN